MEIVFVGIMMLSIIGMAVFEMRDPLSEKFWSDMSDIWHKK